MITYQLTHENYIYKWEDSLRTTIPLPSSILIPGEQSNKDYESYLKWLSMGNIPMEPDIDLDTQSKLFLSKIEEYYDTKAQEKNYDNRYTCALRAGYAGPFQHEGTVFGNWMDSCNRICYDILEDVKLGKRSIPSFEEVISEFPEIDW